MIRQCPSQLYAAWRIPCCCCSCKLIAFDGYMLQTTYDGPRPKGYAPMKKQVHTCSAAALF